jgi:hypothetical protein
MLLIFSNMYFEAYIDIESISKFSIFSILSDVLPETAESRRSWVLAHGISF